MVYWVLLVYIVAALVYWFIALNTQNRQMIQYEKQQLKKDSPIYIDEIKKLNAIEKRKTIQYIGEGSTFLLLILASAVFIFRAVRKQLKSSQQQQNFMMAITHELKTPIAVTKLNLETLQKRKLEEGQQQKLIQSTIQEANRLNALCNNLLISYQLDENAFKVTSSQINLTELVEDNIKSFQTHFPARKILANIEEQIFVKGDAFLIEIANLLSLFANSDC